ncbi:hypothetical protein [Methylovorus glucosotrophus]|uniref:Uncharacterized protein n=1 Tax=Methylovorus glucosotrophus (strain SIP3-4) TaxID=582744 RepID=C6XEB7_METGS|nr:hypothetical protein [Methylovorus glucosotrophus]ACT50892.1 hypothetical protein Msip34_1647 [Methylovorus glucosotrophus SIP3-4]
MTRTQIIQDVDGIAKLLTHELEQLEKESALMDRIERVERLTILNAKAICLLASMYNQGGHPRAVVA